MDVGTSGLLGAEGFDGNPYFPLSSRSITGRFGDGYAYQMPTEGTVRSFYGSIGGAAIRIPTIGPANWIGFSNMLMTVGGGIYGLSVGPTGKLRLSRQDTNFIAETSDPILTSNVWFFIEMSVSGLSPGFHFEVRVNGAVVLLADTDSTVWVVDTFGIGGGNSGTTPLPVDFDDFYVADRFLGDVRVRNLIPDGSGDFTELTPSQGVNWENVVEWVPDYNWSETNGQIDTYTLTSPFVVDDGAAIAGIVVHHSSYHNGGAFYSRKGRVVVRSGTSVDHGELRADRYAGTSYTDLFDIDPDSGLPFTIASIATLQIGVEVWTGPASPVVRYTLDYLCALVVSEVVHTSLGTVSLLIDELTDSSLTFITEIVPQGSDDILLEVSELIVFRVSTGLSPIEIASTSIAGILANLEAYTGEPNDVLMSVLLTGRMEPYLPPPVPPVDFAGLPDPTVAPTVVSSDTPGGHLIDGTYRYAYAAWVGYEGQATGPSPWSDLITLTTDDTVILTYPVILGADGYLVYREEI